MKFLVISDSSRFQPLPIKTLLKQEGLQLAETSLHDISIHHSAMIISQHPVTKNPNFKDPSRWRPNLLIQKQLAQLVGIIGVQWSILKNLAAKYSTTGPTSCSPGVFPTFRGEVDLKTLMRWDLTP